MIIEGAEPFFFRGGSIGVLLIHGFTGSPAELLPLGEFLNRAGFTVLGVRLEGHGTNEVDLSRKTADDWFNSVLDGYALLKSFCEKIALVEGEKNFSFDDLFEASGKLADWLIKNFSDNHGEFKIKQLLLRDARNISSASSIDDQISDFLNYLDL